MQKKKVNLNENFYINQRTNTCVLYTKQKNIKKKLEFERRKNLFFLIKKFFYGIKKLCELFVTLASCYYKEIYLRNN